MTNILYAVLVLSVLGAVFGLLLAYAAKIFAVEIDERQEAILAILPGANCGGCGYPGCSGFASAVVNAGANANGCTAGGSAVAESVAAVMGVKADALEKCVAAVKCSGTEANMTKKLEYVGIDDCLAASRLGGGSGANACPYGCLGFGSCVKACPFGAIYLEGGVAKVDHDKCTGCMTCAKTCPKGIIVKVPYSADVTVACSSKDMGKALRAYCKIGCIACKLCERNCPNDAIHVENNLAVIDYDKCQSCSVCARKCPRGLIFDARLNTDDEMTDEEAEDLAAERDSKEK